MCCTCWVCLQRTRPASNSLKPSCRLLAAMPLAPRTGNSESPVRISARALHHLQELLGPRQDALRQEALGPTSGQRQGLAHRLPRTCLKETREPASRSLGIGSMGKEKKRASGPNVQLLLQPCPNSLGTATENQLLGPGCWELQLNKMCRESEAKAPTCASRFDVASTGPPVTQANIDRRLSKMRSSDKFSLKAFRVPQKAESRQLGFMEYHFE